MESSHQALSCCAGSRPVTDNGQGQSFRQIVHCVLDASVLAHEAIHGLFT
jgi:hypothetical protein